MANTFTFNRNFSSDNALFWGNIEAGSGFYSGLDENPLGYNFVGAGDLLTGQDVAIIPFFSIDGDAISFDVDFGQNLGSNSVDLKMSYIDLDGRPLFNPYSSDHSLDTGSSSLNDPGSSLNTIGAVTIKYIAIYEESLTYNGDFTFSGTSSDPGGGDFQFNVSVEAGALPGLTVLSADTGTYVRSGPTANRVVVLGDTDQILIFGAGDDIIDAGGGDDTVAAGEGADAVNGGSGNDDIQLWSGGDAAMGGAGNDIIRGGSGNDSIVGGTGNDMLYGDADADDLVGDSGDDLIEGGTGNDYLGGSEGDDTLNGGDDNDVLDGGRGDDVMNGDAGDDVLRRSTLGVGDIDDMDGGADFDTADFSLFDHAVWVDLFYTGPTGYEAWTRDNSTVTMGNWRAIADIDNVEAVTGSDFADMIWGDAMANTLNGGKGDDELAGEGGNDTFLYWDDGLDEIDGGADTDTVDFSQYESAIWVDLSYSGATGYEAWTRGGTNVTFGTWQALADLSSVENVIGSGWSDKFYDDLGNSKFEGRNSNDAFYLSGGFDDIDGGFGDDTLDFSEYATAVWVDLDYTGSTGYEAWTRGGTTVTSGMWQAIAEVTQIENLTGSAFDDELRGDSASNTFKGLAGNDRFTFKNGFGNDTILDFQDTGSGFEDVLDFSMHSGVNSMANISFFSTGGFTILEIGPDESILLLGFSGSLGADDFIF